MQNNFGNIIDFEGKHSALLPNAGTAKASFILLLCVLASLLFVALVQLTGYSLMSKYEHTADIYGAGEVYLAQFDFLSDFKHIRKLSIYSTLPYMLIAIANAIVFMVWLYRAYTNLTCMGHSKTNYNVVWTIFCWMVPIVNFFMPYQIVRETWDKTVETASAKKDLEYENTSPAIIVFWWLGWIFSIVISMYIITYSWLRTQTPADVSTVFLISFIGSSISIFTLVCTVIMLRRLARFEKIVFDAVKGS